MKILKDGKRNSGAFKFKCSKCGCKFKADASDYVYVKETSSDASENNEPTGRIKCECPNCKKTMFKELYKCNEKDIGDAAVVIFIIVHIIIGMVLSGFGIVLESVPVFIIGFLLAIEMTFVAFASDGL